MTTAPPTLDRALQLALRYVSGRERTVEEVRTHLLAKIEDAALTEQALAELIELQLLDDERYARVFAEDKQLLESWGGERIRRALLAKGIDRELAARAAAASGEGQLQRAAEVLRQRFPAGPQDPRDRQRAFGVLARKGYDSGLASEAVAAWARGR